MKLSKRLAVILLVIVCLVQLAVPVYSINKKRELLRSGTEYSFKINELYVYDATVKGCVINFYIPCEFHVTNKYGVISVGSDGFAYISDVTSKKPLGADYFVNPSSKYEFTVPADSYVVDGELADKLNEFSYDYNTYDTSWSINESGIAVPSVKPELVCLVVVKDGGYAVKGIFVDNEPIEEYVLTH